MDREDRSERQDILPVPRTRQEAREAYDRISKFYDCTLGLLGRKYSCMALDRLAVAAGETALEIGCGTGHCLKRMAELVGPLGKVYGIDISRAMLGKARRRLEKAGLAGRVELCCGSATSLPFDESTFHAVFLSFTLEVFDTPDIPVVLSQISKVLKPGGRLGIVDMSKEGGRSVFLMAYEWLHKKCPKYLGSRPIYAAQCLIEAGYQTISKEKIKIYQLPAEIVIATKIVNGDAVWQSELPTRASQVDSTRSDV